MFLVLCTNFALQFAHLLNVFLRSQYSSLEGHAVFPFYRNLILNFQNFFTNKCFTINPLSAVLLPSYRNRSTDLHSRSIDWFLYRATLALNELRVNLLGKNNFQRPIMQHKHQQQGRIQNPVKHGDGVFSKNDYRLKTINYFRKKLHLRSFAGFCIRLCTGQKIESQNNQ